MSRATTDIELSLSASEFLWAEEGLSEAHQWILPVLLNWLSAEDVSTILDLGCGNGAMTNELRQAGYQVTGLDSSNSGLVVARASYPAVPFVNGNIGSELPPSLRERFEVVLAVEVIEHLLLPRQLFERASEALVPGGYLIVTTPFHGYWKNLMLALTGSFDKHWHPLRDFGHVKFFSEQTLVTLFLEQGYSMHRSARVGRIPPIARSMMVMGRRSSTSAVPSES
jgi:2-polyprenyl-3-methyl-5-hydroxy-6-metoxy-1,4-benzoquinol methylase